MRRIGPKFLLLGLLILALMGYFAYQGRNYFMGPEITIETPSGGEVINNSYLEVKGQVLNIASLFLNGRQIFTDERGFFSEGLLLGRGYNIIEITATDKFGRVKKEKREVVLE